MNHQKYFRKIVGLPLAMLLIAVLSMMLTPASTVVHAQGPDELPAPLPREVIDYRFGVVGADDASAVAMAAGVGWTRRIFEWDQIQKQLKDRNTFDKFYLDPAVLSQKLPNQQIVGLLINTPTWASSNPDGPNKTVPEGLYLPYDHPDNLWGQFVSTTVYHSKDHNIKSWIIWNEPDKCDWLWDGSIDDYVQLLKVGYQAVKLQDPSAKVVMAATTYWSDVYGQQCDRERGQGEFHYLSQILAAIDKDSQSSENNGFFDAVGVNLYLDPDQMYRILIKYRNKLDEYNYGKKKPLWLTETNIQHLADFDPERTVPEDFSDIDPLYQVTLEEQGHFLVQGWAMAMAARAERIEFHKVADTRTDMDPAGPFGLLREDNSLRPVFWSYRTITTYLGNYIDAKGGYQDVKHEVPLSLKNPTYPEERGIRRVVVERGKLGTTTVVWSRNERTPAEQVDCEDIPVMGTTGTALLVDSFGPIGSISATGNHYRLCLARPTELDDRAGGSPYLIVEGDGAKLCIERAPEHIEGVPPIDRNVSPNLGPLPPECGLPAPSPEVSSSPSPEVPPSPSPEPPEAPSPEAPSPEVPEAPPSAVPSDADWALPNGHFFTQTADGQGGFSVVDDEQAHFFRAYQQLGGAQTVGYPISRRYKSGGFITQAFQKLILQWRPEVGEAWPINLFDELSKAGFDQDLLQNWQIPLPFRSEEFDPPNGSWDEIVAKRQALLAENSAIEAAYFAQSDPLTVFGLPTSHLEDMGTHVAIRTQRTVFHQSAAQGEVTIATGGLIAKELGWLPADALQPEPVVGN